MSARPNEAKPKPEKVSRLAQVLRTGVVYNAQKKALAEQTNLLDLGEDLIYKIMDMVKSPLQTCEIVGIMRKQGWYKTATPTQLLKLIRLLFFDPGLEIVTDRPTNTDAENLAAALAHLQQVLVNNFGQIDDQDPVAWLKKVLRRLCDGYARASTAIRAMEPIQPWEDGFVWGAGPDGASIEIPDSVVAPYPLSTAWHTQTTIVAFLPLQAAKNLTVSYRQLLDAEEEEKQNLKKRAARCLRSPLHRPRGRCREPVSFGYIDIYNDWFSSREVVEGLLKAETPSVRSLPKEFNDSAWLPMADKRMRLSSVIMDTTRVKPYAFYANAGRPNAQMLVDEE